MPSTVWSELYARRSDWALRAYRDFVATIHPTLRGDLERRDHVTLVVFGPTQVGKTTLILTALGIHADHLADVTGVLRGGQGAGRSATVLATRYGKSADGCWRLGEKGGLSGNDMCEVLRSIRDRMESGDDVGSNVVDIRIPRHFFAEAERGLDVSIIDLPGTYAEKENEIRHVARLAEMYVPTADVVLLVTRADRLGALHPAELQLECLKDWVAQPAKFRVVLTYTFSLASIQKWYQEEAKNGGVTVESLRDRLYSQLSTHELPLPEAGSRCLFPVEFGDSWKELATEQADYFAGASGISKSLMDELVGGLASASNPYRRLAAAFDLNALVERKVSRLDAEFEIEKSMLFEEIKGAVHRIRASEKASKLAKKAESNGVVLYEYLGNELVINRIVETIQKAFSIEVRAVSNKTVATVRRHAEEHIDELISAWRRLQFEDDEKAPDSWLVTVMDSRARLPPRVEDAYDELFTKLSKHKLADYYPWMPGSSFEDDCKLLRSSAACARLIAIRETTAWVKVAVEEARKTAKQALMDAGRKARAHKAELARSKGHHRKLLEREMAVEKAHDEARKDMEAGVNRSRMFRKRMIKGHRRRDDELLKEIHNEASPSRRFLLLALRELHQREFPQSLEENQK